MYIKERKWEIFKKDIKLFFIMFFITIILGLLILSLFKKNFENLNFDKKFLGVTRAQEGEGEGGQPEADPGWFLEIILRAVYGSIWFLLIQPTLCLIFCCDWVIKYLSTGLVNDILFGGEKFDITKIPEAFWIISAISLMCAILIFFFQYISTSFNEEMPVGLKISKSLKGMFRAMFFVLLIPVFFFFMSIVSKFLIDAINLAFSTSGQSLSDIIFGVGYSLDGDLTNLLNERINQHAGEDDFKWLWSRYALDTGDKTEWKILLNMNYLVTILCVAFTLYTTIMMSIIIIQKVFELVLLFIAGPLVAATMVNDDGRRMNMWKDEVIAKSLASWGAIFSYNVWIMVINICLAKFNADITNSFLRQVILIVLIVGGALFSLGVSSMLAAFIGDGVGSREGMGQLRSMGHLLGMSKVGGSFLKRAVGFGNSGRKRAMNNIGIPDARSGGVGESEQDKVYNHRITPQGIYERSQGNRKKATGVPGMVGTGLRATMAGVGFGVGIFTGKSIARMASGTKGAGNWVKEASRDTFGAPVKESGRRAAAQYKLDNGLRSKMENIQKSNSSSDYSNPQKHKKFLDKVAVIEKKANGQFWEEKSAAKKAKKEAKK